MRLNHAFVAAIWLSHVWFCHQRVSGENSVKITAVNPTRGSLAGGTRLHIQGSGFSPSTGGGNLVFVGDLACDTIPLHSTESQIACKTRPMLNGAWDEWIGWTKQLNVVVIVNGKRSECLSAAGCIFSYHYGWYHTPRIYDIFPVAVSEGTILTVDGRFHAKPFSVEEIGSPAREIPLASVKVAAREDEQQPQNEPFGKSGTRCALFDPDTEEPYGVTERNSNEVEEFLCRVGGPREAGRYNLSVALLGTAMTPDSSMNMGEAHAAMGTYQSDHTGMSFQLQHMPRIDEVAPPASGMLGGALLTLTGDSFSNNASEVEVAVQGVKCAVVAATAHTIICRLAEAVTAPAGGEQPGARGLHMRLWRQEGDSSLEDFWQSGISTLPDLEWVEMGLAEFPDDVRASEGDSVGPVGVMRGFFRPPVTSNYTFVVASDDSSELWIASTPRNATAVERILSFGAHASSRNFERISWQFGYGWNMETQVEQGVSKRSTPVSLQIGEFRYLEAAYRSHTGADNMALGAILHASPVNRKDSPFAIDEQQLVELDADVALELHNVSVNASGSASFKLRVGGKTSRALRWNASADEMRAAVRELLSDCAGALGDAADGGGSAFDCFQGYGTEYRGLADSIAATGDKCARWDAVPDRPHLGDAFLRLAAGTDKNLCRNPWYSSDGPQCLDSDGNVQRCAVPRCGGSQSARAAMVATFDEEEDAGLPFTNAFAERNGVTPVIDRSTAFCGSGSLFLHNTFATLREQQWLRDPTKPSNNYPYGTKDFPYLCMAYRIPYGSEVGMLVLHDRANEENRTSGTQWKTLSLTNTQVHPNYFELDRLPVVTDGEWHYTCFNLDHAMDTTEDDDFVPGANHLVRSIIFWAEGVEHSTYGSNPFWIDEFSVASTPRHLERSEAPDLGGVRAKVASVTRSEHGGAITWQLALTSDDCTPPDAALEIVEVDGQVASAVAMRVQEHSPQLEGELVVSFKGEAAAFSPYASAADAQAALSDGISTLGGEVAVHRTGTCQTGHGWLVTMTHAPGDQPQLEATLPGGGGALTVQTVQDGGLLMGPLAADYFHLPTEEAPDVMLVVNNAAATCSAASGCNHSREEALTPALAATSTRYIGGGTFALDVEGSGFTAASGATGEAQVSIEGFECVVATVSDTSIACSITSPFIPAGAHAVSVVVPGKGGALGNATFVYPLNITSLSPSSANVGVPTTITVSGLGFDPSALNNSVVVDGEPCAVLNVSATQLVCQLTPRAAGTAVLVLHAGASSARANLTLYNVSAPRITSVHPPAASAGGGSVLTIVGQSFSSDAQSLSVLIAGRACTVLASSQHNITCAIPAGPVGSVPLLVSVADRGEASTDYQYQLSVDRVSPSSTGFGGGTTMEIEGRGFDGGAEATATLTLDGTQVFVVGLYVPELREEVHEVRLKGRITSEVQTVTVPASAAFFQLASPETNRTTDVMPAGVSEEVLADQVNALNDDWTVTVPGDKFLSATGEPFPGIGYNVQWPGEQGDVPMLQGLGCASANASSCAPGGVSVSESVKGTVPTGNFTLTLRDVNRNASNSSNMSQWLAATLPAMASVGDMQGALDALRPGVAVQVKRSAHPGGVTWAITYDGYNGAQALPEAPCAYQQSSSQTAGYECVPCTFQPLTSQTAGYDCPENSSAALHGATVEVSRVAEGTALPEGGWRIGRVGGNFSAQLAMDASEQQVQAAVQSALPELRGVRVVAADGVPGKLLDRAYPRQWAIRFKSREVPGLGRARCTQPLYIDWDPSACPSHAAELFLSHYPWYWPTALPQPVDLSEAANQARLQALCDAEATGRGLEPTTCNAPVPKETLPVCGQGSGVRPPCWVARFSTAKVAHLDGTEVEYERDDAMAPRDTQKGYRAWRRTDLASQVAEHGLVLDANISAVGAGMHLERVYHFPADIIPCATTVASPEKITATVPPIVNLTWKGAADLAMQDALYQPAATLLSDRDCSDRPAENTYVVEGTLMRTVVASSGRLVIEPVPDEEAASDFGCFPGSGAQPARGPIDIGGPGAVDFSPARNSSLQQLFDSAYNSPEYTVDFWLKLRNATRRMPILSSMGPQQSSGYAVVVTEDARLEHWQRVDSNSLSVISSVAPEVDAWTHVAVTFDGREQSMFQNGVKVNSSVVRGAFKPNKESDLTIGGRCSPGAAEPASALTITIDTSSSFTIQSRDQFEYLDAQPIHSRKLMQDFGLSLAITTDTSASFTVESRDTFDYPSCGDEASTWDGFDGALSSMLFYDSAISPGAIAAHAAIVADSENMTAEISVDLGSAMSECHGTCSLSIEAGKTPIVDTVSPLELSDSRLIITAEFHDIAGNTRREGDIAVKSSPGNANPTVVWDEGTIMLTGRRLDLAANLTIHVGDHECVNVVQANCSDVDTPAPLCEESVSCRVQVGSNSTSRRSGPMPVSVFHPEAGSSVNEVEVTMAARVISVTPSVVSLMGGSRLTVAGNGFSVASLKPPELSAADATDEPQVAGACAPSEGPETPCLVHPGYFCGSLLTATIDVGRSFTMECRDTFDYPRVNEDKGYFGAQTPDSLLAPMAGSSIQIKEPAAAAPSLDFDGAKCKNVVLIDGAYECELQALPTTGDPLRRSERNASTISLTRLPGLDALLCNPTSACVVSLAANATPVITSLFPTTVSNGTLLTISGVDLPAQRPAIMVGEIPCTVTADAVPHQIVCTVGAGVGGVYEVSVRFEQGFAQTPHSGCCLQVTYAVNVSAATPSNGSAAGGQLVTLMGSGFAQTVGGNRVFVGGRRSEVLMASNTSVVIRTPALGFANDTALGLDFDVYHQLIACEVAGHSCDSPLQECYGHNGSSLKLPLVTTPASGRGAAAEWLVDGSPSTVWNSQDGVALQVIAMDLGAVRRVTGVLVRWEGRPSAESINVSVGSASCGDLQLVHEETVNASLADLWDATSAALFASIEARYVELSLALRPGMEEFRIKDIVILPSSTNKTEAIGVLGTFEISVIVGGSFGFCSSAGGCTFSYVAPPTIHTVAPSSGVTDDLVNISGSGLDELRCEAHDITVGGATCHPESCSASWITCTLGRQAAGAHMVQLSVPGVGQAAGQAWFTYELMLSRVTPPQGGLGGGLVLAVDGAGFNADGALHVTVCGTACPVLAASESNLSCIQGPVVDVAKAVDSRSFTVVVDTGEDDAMEDVDSGTIFHADGTLRFDKFWGRETSLKRVFLRFASVDIANNASVASARLIVNSGETLCEQGSQIRVWAEAGDHSASFQSASRSSLGSRPRTAAFVDWELSEAWKWAGDSQESVDLSTVIQAVVSRPGWRAGNALTLVLQQMRNGNDYTKGCELMAFESGSAYAAKLRLEVNPEASSRTAAQTEECSVSVSSASLNHGGLEQVCSHGKRSLVAAASVSASSSQTPAGPNVLFKEAFAKPEAALQWEQAAAWCTRQGSRLCLREQVLDAETKLPFFGVQAQTNANFSIKVPVWRFDAEAAKPEVWVDVSSPLVNEDCGDESCPQLGDVHWHWGTPMTTEESILSTTVIPCCGFSGHLPHMAADGDFNTYWQSEAGDSAVLALDLGLHGALVVGIEIHWGAGGYASEYAVMSRVAGANWTTQYTELHGDGGVDQISFSTEVKARFLSLSLSRHADDEESYSVIEVVVHGCSLEPTFTTTTVSTEPAGLDRRGLSSALFIANETLTPTITSVTPSMGSTAGGSDITVVGRFFTEDKQLLAVSFGDFPCEIQTVAAAGGDLQSIECVSSASGVLNGGKKFVSVTSQGFGSTVRSTNATFWYIDAWSARTTWGGQSPPTGCGSWVEDQGCTESVVIPAGQVVLLDMNLPRFYLILIEGVLIFDRQDLSIGASYLLLRGGTLQIGTEDVPFENQATITLFGHPKSIELPIFGAKVLACYQCTLDLHGTPQVAWTKLAATANAGDTVVTVEDAVTWPVGSKIVVATTDFESPWSSHTEVATVSNVSPDGKQLSLSDIGVCSNYSFSGQPLNCRRTSSLSYMHISEDRTFDGTQVAFRAEVGLLSRNIQIVGDHDARLCPLADTAEDGVTLLSCNQFGAQILLHSPGHESLVARLSNVEIKNAGQAFRLGRYAIHWHMIGNVRESYQRNLSIHHSWNRGAAIHGSNYLQITHNVLYNIMGHALFIEDGVEEYNVVKGNLGIKVTPSMSLLNTDQTPAVFWIVTGKNYILNNHAVASRRYGIWFRPEISATGTSVNTPDVHPRNIPLLEFDGNQAHSNGKYGLRVFDEYVPNDLSVFRNTFVWRNGKVGWTATVIGRVAFDGIISVQNGHHVFESRATTVGSWEECYVVNGLFVDDPEDLPLSPSYASFADSFGSREEMGGPMKGGLLLPWNEWEDGGMVISNCTFVNFVNPCLRGCAHCGRGGSPVVGDGGFETRFRGMKFINSPERALFRHPNEAFLYDLDGSLTDSGIAEDYTQGGIVRGASFVGDSVLLPNDGSCSSSSMSTQGTGGVVCVGHIFRRMWYHIQQPSSWVGKALCVRMPHQTTINTCQSLQPECNCLPYLKKAWKGNVWLAAEGLRYNVQMDLLSHELADPQQWKLQVWATYRMEDFFFTQRFLQWDVVDEWGRPLYWSEIGGQSQSVWPLNYFYNESACSSVGCGQLQAVSGYPHTSYDVIGGHDLAGIAVAGEVPIPEPGSTNGGYTIKEDADENGVLHTLHVRGRGEGDSRAYDHRSMTATIHPCPKEGCWPPPQPPSGLPKTPFSNWSNPATWANLTSHPANPLNKLETIEVAPGEFEYRVLESVAWEGELPGEAEDVWIPSWKQVLLDVDTPVLGRLVVEGVLVINASSVVDLSATWIEIKGGSLVIATTDANGTAVAPFVGSTNITLHGTNSKLAAVHGANPRHTPEIVLGTEGVKFGAAGLGVMGRLVAIGQPTTHSAAPLAQSASAGETEIVVDALLEWEVGSEVVVVPTDFDMHESDVARVVSVEHVGNATVLTLDSALQYAHYAGELEVYGARELRMRARVALLSHNIVIRGTGEGEDRSYEEWNAPQPSDAADAQCGNGLCEQGESSLSCPQDCSGPAYEYGASVLVAGYTEDFTYCTREYVCSAGFQRTYEGSAEMRNVELRYFGQNNLRPGIMFSQVNEGNSSLSFMSLNRGYYHGISIEQSSGVTVNHTVIFRSLLPALRIMGGSHHIVANSMGVIGIFWNTHRGARQGKGLSKAKLNAMIGMFHDEGQGTIWQHNVAAGSERAGFSGPGVSCDDSTSFVGNEAHSCLNGYWFDHYGLGASSRTCTALTDMRAWKIFQYAVYGEVPRLERVVVRGLRAADARVGVYVLMVGVSAAAHARLEQKVQVEHALIVGHSGNAHCETGAPRLFACSFYMAWCAHLGLKHRGVFISQFLSSGTLAPTIKPWFNAGAYPALYGQTELTDVTFANFGQRCSAGARQGIVDAAVSGLPAAATAADAWHPVTLSGIEKVEVEPRALAFLDPPSPSWINQADCVDMDCDGPKHALLRDEDGSFIGGGGGSVLPRSEAFSEGSFFGTEYKDPVNLPDDPWWYPNVPTVMRTNRAGDLLNLTDTWLRRGFGLARKGCTLEAEWNAWRCPATAQPSHRRLIIESLDADREIRRISPVALSSESGYTDMLNGCMDHGWCFSYTCLKRLMTFWAVVSMDTSHTVHFTGTNPQKMRVSLPFTPSSEKIVLKIYYQTSLRMQVFVGKSRRLVEDMNVYEGRQKALLVRDGRWAPNDGADGYEVQLPSLTCACMIGNECRSELLCLTPSNEHGANRFNRAEGVLEIVLSGHGVDEFIDIEGMPVVSVSMSVSVSVDQFYNIMDSFISTLSDLLLISPANIRIVDVVAGNARRRSLLQSNSSSSEISLEILPEAELAAVPTMMSVLETQDEVTITVQRTVNVLGSCSVQYEVITDGYTAQGGVNFVTTAGVLHFASSEVSKTINVTILSQPGHAADTTVAVLLSQAVNATITDDTTMITIQNVHPPTPTALRLNGVANASSVPLTWSFDGFEDAPTGLEDVIGYELECRTPETSSSWIEVAVQGSRNASVFGGLSAFALVECRVRVECVGGLSNWSSIGQFRSASVCGDGERHGSEECDDGALDADDGCSSVCSVEAGWACELGDSAPDSCTQGCGNGTVDAGEECDDGGSVDGDGCSASCRVEGGWTCAPSEGSQPSSASVCNTTCGDGYRVASHEGCDDNNTVGGDGCAENCSVEVGSSCSDGADMLSVCQTCGNSVVEGTEVCDGSSAACLSCAAVRAGWSCSGSPSICVGGPYDPAAPSLVDATQTTLSIIWSVADGNGLAVDNYTVIYTNGSGALVGTHHTQTTSATIANLTAGTSYLLRVRACHAAGCSGFGPYAAFKTSSLSAAAVLSEIAGGVEAAVGDPDIESLVGSVNVSLTVPPEEPQGPDASNDVGLLNETDAINDLQDALSDGTPASDFGIAMTSTTAVAAAEGSELSLAIQLVLLADNSTVHSGSSEVISVTWELQSSTEVDVDATGGVVYFALGQATAQVLLTLNDNDHLSYPDAATFSVVLTASSGGSVLLPHLGISRVVSIIDDERPPTAAFGADAFAETSLASLEAVVSKTVSPQFAVRVYYSTIDGTAVAGTDYVAVSNGVAEIAAGEHNSSNVAILILRRSGSFSVRITAVSSECIAGSGVFACEGVIGVPNMTTANISRGGGYVCGNGVLQSGESCDDGNVAAIDGCDEQCAVEPGYACAGTSCSMPSTPEDGQAFVRATSRLNGVSDSAFDGPAFRSGVAGVLGLQPTQVGVESVSRRRAEGATTVTYRLIVAAAEASGIAALLEAVHSNGELLAALQGAGLPATGVRLTSTPQIVLAPEDQGSPSDSESGHDRTLAALLGGLGAALIVLTLALVCCPALIHQSRQRAAAEAEAEAGSDSSGPKTAGKEGSGLAEESGDRGNRSSLEVIADSSPLDRVLVDSESSRKLAWQSA